jgi:hypothetical protein
VETNTFNDLAGSNWFRTVYTPMRLFIQHHLNDEKAAFTYEWGPICDVPSKFKQEYCTGEGE